LNAKISREGKPALGAQLLNGLKSEAHVWLAFSDEHSDPELLAWYRDQLSEEEREKYRRFYFTRDRDLYLLTHGFVRAILSQYLKIASEKWVFTKNRYGRAEIAQPEGKLQLRFNVSRTQGVVACLTALSIDAGVDVERIRELDNLKTLSEHVLTPHELSRHRDLPESDQIQEFFTLWTLKEAYVKARGTGLSLPLKGFAFCFDNEGRVRISIDHQLQDMSSEWQFEVFRPTQTHVMAIALRRKNKSDLRIRVLESVPGLSGQSIPCLKQYSF
jgi:4'-phosphopantetheinyl transferase